MHSGKQTLVAAIAMICSQPLSTVATARACCSPGIAVTPSNPGFNHR
jgi:hypothetical protein